MRLYPAIDILDGRAVRLRRGDYGASKVYDEDPLAAARRWVSEGAGFLHVVDLDGARAGAPSNIAALSRIAGELGVPVQFGGGLRSAQDVARALGAGAERVILGTAAFTDGGLLAELLAEHPAERILVAVDVRAGLVATHGWLKNTELPAPEAFAGLVDTGVRRFVYTNIDHDGMLDGTSREEVVAVARAAGEGSVIFSGGIGSLEHLGALARLRGELDLDALEGVIVGTALYEGRFTVAQALAALAEE